MYEAGKKSGTHMSQSSLRSVYYICISFCVYANIFSGSSVPSNTPVASVLFTGQSNTIHAELYCLYSLLKKNYCIYLYFIEPYFQPFLLHNSYLLHKYVPPPLVFCECP